MIELALSLLVIAFLVWYIIRRKQTVELPASEGPSHDLKMPDQRAVSSPLVYYGSELHFTEEILDAVLAKHLPYYAGLLDFDREKFRTRLRKFIENKIFIIHDKSGFREMPILISASAIQLTLGLKKYTLSHFSVVQVYPKEFVGLEPFRILMGNVSGNTINIAWNHFFFFFFFFSGVQNVLLYEISYAIY